jgi:toxin ParE1/3/4
MTSEEKEPGRELIIAPTARRDLLAIWDRIAADNPEAADRMSDKLFDAFHQLQLFPGSGRPRRELAGDRALRFWHVGEYQIAYRVSENAVEIAAILHGRRDIPAVFREREPGDAEE